MNHEIEIEFKNLLEKEEFYHLVDAFTQQNSFVSQTNYYFETPSFLLKKKKCALRIREKNHTYTLTLKRPHTVGLLESHESLTKEEAEAVLKSPNQLPDTFKSLLEDLQISVSDLTLLGSLTTNRTEIPYRGGLLVLDHSTYLGWEDYEVEYEVQDEQKGKEVFLELLQHHHIPVRKTKNKIQRFFDKSFEL